MYLDENIANGVAVADAVVILQDKLGVDAVTTKYGTYDANGKQITAPTAVDGQRALSDLEAALAQGNATMVTVNATTMWSTSPQYVPSGTPNYTTLSHEAVVIAVDLKAGKVYMNDSGPSYGKYMEVPLGAFLSAWQTSDYELTVVSPQASAAQSDVSAA
jgi:hypothetical protein